MINFLGCAGLTFTWLAANSLFFGVIADAIYEHNAHIRRQKLKEQNEHLSRMIKKHNEPIIHNIKVLDARTRKLVESEDESGNEDDNESEVETEVVVETVTETILKS